MNVSQYIRENYVPVPESGCWLWLGNWTQNGYGAVKHSGRWLTGAHRLFYELHRGPIPDGLLVCHKCDTPVCVNPEHLFLGTHADNVHDKVRKGRHKIRIRPTGAPRPKVRRESVRKGSQVATSKLTEADVYRMRQLRAEGRTFASLADQFGVDKKTAIRACKGKQWLHVPSALGDAA